MTGRRESGRPNQRIRTRKDLLQAAARLLRQQGRKPTLDEVAAEAMVSRATAYRYFPSVEALLVEAALDIATPDPKTLFAAGAPADPVARLERADEALWRMIQANETSLRIMLAESLQRVVAGGAPDGVPLRQNRRSALIEAALEPARGKASPEALKTLSRALSLVLGTEAMIVFKDVLRLPDAEARRVRRWTIRTLVEAALAPPQSEAKGF